MADLWFFADQGINNILVNMTVPGGTPPPGNGVLRLYQNNPSPAPSKSSVLGDLTQCTFPGYAPVTLVTADWGSPTIAANVASVTASSAKTYTRSTTGAGQTVYGAYITDSGNTLLYAVCLFAGGPFTLATAGDKVNVLPTLTMQSKN